MKRALALAFLVVCFVAGGIVAWSGGESAAANRAITLAMAERIAAASPTPAALAAARKANFDGGLLGKPRILLPDGPVTGAVFQFSDQSGWGPGDDAVAGAAQKTGAIVVGIDTPKLLASLETYKDGDCVYLVSDIESLSHEIQRALGTPNYFSPIVAGVGSGAALGLGIAAQTPDATMGQTVSVDPTIVLPLKMHLCTDAPRLDVSNGAIYGLATGDLTNPVDVLFTPAAPGDTRSHVARLQAQGFGIRTKDVTAQPLDALQSRLVRLLTPATDIDNPLADLPLVVLPSQPKLGAMAVIYSGDGGWRDLDKSIGDAFQKIGVPTIGVDSLRYFWSKKTPDQTGTDLKRIIDTYTQKWGVDRVILIGYSFGADVLPAAYNRLPVDEQSQVAQMSLLGFSDQVDYQISVGAFLGTSAGEGSTLPDVARIKPAIIQCVYGQEEDDSACLKLQGTGVEMLETTGGHHFDGDYDALAAKILDSYRHRTAPIGGTPIAAK